MYCSLYRPSLRARNPFCFLAGTSEILGESIAHSYLGSNCFAGPSLGSDMGENIMVFT
jgi:hypothetical protein